MEFNDGYSYEKSMGTWSALIGNQFIDPKKRVFVAYIGISILIAFLWFILLRKYSLFAAFKKIFDKKIFFSE